MCQQRRQIDDSRRLIDHRGLHGRDLMLAQGLANDLEPAGKRRIAELPWTALPALRLDRADQRFLRIGEFDLCLGQRGGECSDGLDRCIAHFRVHKIEADGSSF